MKVRITEPNILRKITVAGLVKLLEEAELYQKMVKEIKKTETSKLRVMKKYMRCLKNITFSEEYAYKWSRK